MAIANPISPSLESLLQLSVVDLNASQTVLKRPAASRNLLSLFGKYFYIQQDDWSRPHRVDLYHQI